jgi:hypothetical protein
MGIVRASPGQGARPSEGERRRSERRGAVREPVVDDRRSEGARVEGGTHRAGGCGAPGELGRDDRPGGIRVATTEVEAPQAGSRAGLDQRPDPHARVVEDDRQVRHIAPQPGQVSRGRQNPRRGEHRQRRAVGAIVRHGDRLVAEGLEIGLEMAGDGLGGVDGDHRGAPGRRAGWCAGRRAGCPTGGLELGSEYGRERGEDPVHVVA